MEAIIGIIFGIIAMLGFGIQNFLQTKLIRKIGAFRYALWLEIGVAMMLLFLSLFFLNAISLQITVIGMIFLTAVISFIGLFSFSKGFQVGNVPIVVTVASAYGAVTAILGVLLLGERITPFQIFDVILIVVGTILVSLELKGVLKGGAKKRNLGIRYALITAFAWGFFFLLLSLIVNRIGWFQASLFVDLATVLVFLAYGLATGNKMRLPTVHFPYIIVLCALNLIAFLAFNLGVSYNYAAIVTPIAAASPIIVITLTFLLLKERLAKNQLLGIALILIGLVALSL